MENLQTLNRRFEAVAWGALFVLWGVMELFPSLPKGTGALGIGIILLGLNAARSLKSVPTSGFTTTIGILAFVLGVLELSRLVIRLPFEIPVFGILLIVLGMIFLGRELLQSRTA